MSGIVAAVEGAEGMVEHAVADVLKGLSSAPASPAAPAAPSATVITPDQLRSAVGAGEAFIAEMKEFVRNIGDVDNDLNIAAQATAFVAQFVPTMALVPEGLMLLKLLFDGAKALHDDGLGLPTGGADWSHGLPHADPVANHADNPSGVTGYTGGPVYPGIDP